MSDGKPQESENLPKTQPQKAVQSLAEQTVVESAPVLGELIWWSIGGPLVGRRELGKFLAEQERGVYPSFPKLRTRTALRRGLLDLQTDNLFIRMVGETEEKVIYAIVEETDDDSAETASYDVENVVVYDKTTGKIRLKTAKMKSETLAKIKEALASIQSNDVASFIKKMLRRCDSVRLRENGGVYFVPFQRESQVDLLESLLGQIGPNCHLYRLPLVAHGESKKTVAEVARQQIVAHLYEIRDELKAYEKTEDISLKKTAGVIRRLKELRDKTNVMMAAVAMDGKKIGKVIRVFVAKMNALREQRGAKVR